MSSNLGRKVKWQDDKGGWHTGRVVTGPCGDDVRTISGSSHGWILLIKENNCGTLSWVAENKLSKWPDVEYCSVCCREKDRCVCKPGNQTALLRNYEYERMFASMPQPTPQSKVTREEVLQAASEESMLSQRSLLQQALEQIKEEEEALLTLNSKLQEEYAEQVIQN